MSERKSFIASKKLLTSSELLVHFNPHLKIILACDASSYGVRAMLAHRMPDGSERPFGYASHSLLKAEKNYSQLEREGLACVFGMKWFHQYQFGHSFDLIMDHKPLLALETNTNLLQLKHWEEFAAGHYSYQLMNTIFISEKPVIMVMQCIE